MLFRHYSIIVYDILHIFYEHEPMAGIFVLKKLKKYDIMKKIALFTIQ